jgi:hypothetical protein
MAIQKLDKEIFLVCYLLFMAAILLLPVFCNVYSLLRYKMSFSKYSKQIIDSFLEKKKIIYIAKYNAIRSIFLFFLLFILIITTKYIIYSGDKYNQYYLLLISVVFIFIHIAWIVIYISYLYDACYMTNTSMLIRGIDTWSTFKIVQLHDIKKYRTDNFYTLERFYISGRQHLTIITKCNKAFHLKHLDNREQLIDALKYFTNSIEET